MRRDRKGLPRRNGSGRRPLLNTPRQAAQWLLPGLVVKRWVLTSACGLLLLVLGIGIWANLKPVYWTLSFIEWVLGSVTQIFPYRVTGPLVLAVGVVLVFIGQSRAFGSIKQALAPGENRPLVDALLEQRRLNRGPNVVAIGGGTGLATLLSGLKHYSSNITAVVTVADDGGSSGRLRRDLGMQPPGDIRNCLTALAKEEELLTQLFRYRFAAGEGLEGHSFGNLFLSALTGITGDLESAIATSSAVLAIQGQVVPATTADVQLWAELEDGRMVEGESRITGSQGRIRRVGCRPASPPALPRALKALRQADLILLGPGSLYTSLLPNLLVPELTEAISRSSAAKLYICNLMTQPGETDGLDVAGHLRVIEAHVQRHRATAPLFRDVLVQRGSVHRQQQDTDQAAGAEPVTCVPDQLRAEGFNVHQAAMQAPPYALRHDPQRLARAVIGFYRRHQKQP